MQQLVIPPNILNDEKTPFHCGLVQALWGKLINDRDAEELLPSGAQKECIDGLSKDVRTMDRMKREFFLTELKIVRGKIVFKRSPAWSESPALKKERAA